MLGGKKASCIQLDLVKSLKVRVGDNWREKIRRVLRVERVCDSRSDREPGQELNAALSLICQWCRDWWCHVHAATSETPVALVCRRATKRGICRRGNRHTHTHTHTDANTCVKIRDSRNVYVFMRESEGEKRDYTPLPLAAMQWERYLF